MSEFTPHEHDSPEAKRYGAAFDAKPADAIISPLPAGPLFSSPKGFYGPGVLANVESQLTGKSPEQAYAKRVPQLETATNVLGSLLAPGKTLLGRAVSQAGVSGGLKAVSGASPLKAAEAAGGAALGQLGGEVAMKGLGKAFSATQLPRYATTIADSVSKRLQEAVPPWKGMAGLKDMFFSQTGWNKLHQFADTYMKDAMKRGENKFIQVSMDDAKALGIKELVANANPTITTVGINAGKAVEAATGKWTKNAGLYARVMGALDEAGVGDPAARKAYKTAMGLRAYFMKQGAIRPDGSLDLVKAQAGLVKGKSVDELLKRGLGAFSELLMPGGKAIQTGTLKTPLGIAGGILGGVGGHSFGLLPIGSLFGAYHGARLGQRIPTYSNIPPGSTLNFLQRIVPRLGATIGGQAGPQGAEVIQKALP